jgi:hypothetical protein
MMRRPGRIKDKELIIIAEKKKKYKEKIDVMLQPPPHARSSLADFSTLKVEAIRSSETSVHTISTQRHITENSILHSHRCENLKSYHDSEY